MYELNIQNVKHKNEQFYKLANDYVSQIKFEIWNINLLFVLFALVHVTALFSSSSVRRWLF